MYKIDIPCSQCGKLTTKTLPNKSSAVKKYELGLQKCFCSKECKLSWHSSNYTFRNCKKCKKKFRYFPSDDSSFCSKQCYYEDMKDNPDKYGLREKVAIMHKTVDKVAATKKMLDTKLEKGQIVDWKNATWKQWYRRCNAILQKKRKLLIENWDGTDYIDGEYIRDFLTLPYHHKNYPTLDHVIPKQTEFLQGLTPEESCRNENLKWTKRSNNSKKGY